MKAQEATALKDSGKRKWQLFKWRHEEDAGQLVGSSLESDEVEVRDDSVIYADP